MPAVSVPIICIIFFQLTVEWTSNEEPKQQQVKGDHCLLSAPGATTRSSNLCYLGYAITGISLIASLLLTTLLFATCTACLYIVPWLDLILSLVGGLLWTATAVALTIFNADASDHNLPKQSSHNAVTILSWINVLLFGIYVAVATCSVCYSVYGRCGGRREAEGRNIKLAVLRSQRQADTIERIERQRHSKRAAFIKMSQLSPATSASCAAEPQLPLSIQPRGDIERGASHSSHTATE